MEALILVVENGGPTMTVLVYVNTSKRDGDAESTSRCSPTLAAAANYNPKVIRQGLRLAFLAPEMTEAALGEAADFKLQQNPQDIATLLAGAAPIHRLNSDIDCYGTVDWRIPRSRME